MKILNVLITVLFCTFLSLMQVQGATSVEQQKTQANEKAVQKVRTNKMHGTIVSINVETRNLILKTERTNDTLNVEPGAKIMGGSMELSKELTIDDLQTGFNVAVTWEKIDSLKSATKIVVLSVFDTAKTGAY
jgi:hypothetical protein